MGLNSINEAKQILQGYAPPGESLAFINPSEAQALKGMGGSGAMTEAGIPTYFGGIGSWMKDTFRKVMPNEAAEFGGKIAPIVSMMGPWGAVIGAGLSWNAEFDKTGRMGSSLKKAAKTYAVGKVGQAVGGEFGATAPGGQQYGLESLGEWDYWTDVGDWGQAGYTPYSLSDAAASQAADIATASGDIVKPEIIDPANPLARQIPPTERVGYTGTRGYDYKPQIGTAGTEYSALNFKRPFGSLPPTERVGYTGTRGYDYKPQIGTTTSEQAALNTYQNRLGGKGVYDFDPSVEHKEGPSYRTKGDPNVTKGDPKLSGGTENTKNFTWEKFKEFWDASATEKWNMAKEWFNSLDDVTKLQLGVGTVTAALTYLDNEAMKDERINVPDYADIAATDYSTRGLENVNPELSLAKDGGIIGLAQGGEPMVERDYRPGGFIPVGAQERADDVPARLSKNEFVMTADAVRAAGGGSVNLGSQRMYDLMNRLEAAA